MASKKFPLEEPRQLKAITADEFSKLKDGEVYGYRIDDEPVRVSVLGRGKVRLACIDLDPSGWKVKPEVVWAFEREWRRAMAAHGIKIDHPRIFQPGGKSHLSFSVPKAAQGELLYLAAQLLSDKSNLVTILRPEWEKAFAPIKARRKVWMAQPTE